MRFRWVVTQPAVAVLCIVADAVVDIEAGAGTTAVVLVVTTATGSATVSDAVRHVQRHDHIDRCAVLGC